MTVAWRPKRSAIAASVVALTVVRASAAGMARATFQRL
jgi:hypothetical protein